MNHLGMVYLSAAATILQYDQLKIKILSFMKTVFIIRILNESKAD
jgi:hypothetical protein